MLLGNSGVKIKPKPDSKGCGLWSRLVTNRSTPHSPALGREYGVIYGSKSWGQSEKVGRINLLRERIKFLLADIEPNGLREKFVWPFGGRVI